MGSTPVTIILQEQIRNFLQAVQTTNDTSAYSQRGGGTAMQQHLGTAEYSRLQQIQRNAELVQRTQRWYSAHITNTAHYSTSTAQIQHFTARYSCQVQLHEAPHLYSKPASCACSVQHKYSTNTAQMQHKYSTHAIRIQLEFSSIYFTQKGRKTAKRQEELESGIRAYNYTIKYFIAYICYKCTYKV